METAVKKQYLYRIKILFFMGVPLIYKITNFN